MTIITDEYTREMMAKTKTYTVLLLKAALGTTSRALMRSSGSAGGGSSR